MAYSAFRVRRRFQFNEWIHALPGKCECSLGETVASQAACNLTVGLCKGSTATGCECPDYKYCGDGGYGGACGIKPHQYAGNIFIIQSGNPKLEYLLKRHFIVYDAAIPSVDELLRHPKYQALVDGLPTPGLILFAELNKSVGVEGIEDVVRVSEGVQGSLDELAAQLVSK